MTWTKCLEVYDKDQVYPEYLVLYERLHGERPPEPPPKETRWPPDVMWGKSKKNSFGVWKGYIASIFIHFIHAFHFKNSMVCINYSTMLLQ